MPRLGYLSFPELGWSDQREVVRENGPSGKAQGLSGGNVRMGNEMSSQADGQAKMSIMSSLRCRETEQAFHVLNISYFPPLRRQWRCLLHFPIHGMDWTPLNTWMALYISKLEVWCVVGNKFMFKFPSARPWFVCYICIKHKVEKCWKTLAGHLKSFGSPRATGWTALTYICNATQKVSDSFYIIYKCM